MTLPLTDSALIGTCLAASALGLIILTSAGGNSATPAPVAQTVTQVAPPSDNLTQTGTAMSQAQPVDAEFGAQVRSYLLQNPEVIFEAVAAFEQRNATAQAEMDRSVLEANADALFNDGHSWVGGNPDGDITLVEFLDYRCGFCKRAYDEVAALLDADGGIRLIVKEFPILGPDSELASRFAVASLRLGGDEVYAQVHESLIRHDDPITLDFLDSLATAQGLEFEAILAEMDSAEVGAVLAANYELAQRLQISGTPTFVMESEMIRGFVGAEVLIEMAESLRN